MACTPGEACWIRAGEPLVLHWMSSDAPNDGMRRALCGDASSAWLCVDEYDLTTAAECARCALAATGQLELLPTPRI